MKHALILVGCALLGLAVSAASAADDQAAAYPKPSPVPISWELTFKHSDPKRIVVNIPGDPVPRPFWYITYSVTNEPDPTGVQPSSERIFYPVFTMCSEDGTLIPGNDGIHPAVFDAIKAIENNKFLEDPTLIGGRILLGQDQTRESVAIWPETSQRMGSFTIFATGMWGETAVARDSDGNPLKDAKGADVELHKTLMMRYHVDGDATHFSRVRKIDEQSVMR
jgi:hypothetical protein